MKFKSLIGNTAKQEKVPPGLLATIVDIESSFKPKARRYENHLDQDVEVIQEFEKFKEYSDKPNHDDEKWEESASYGLCQLLGSTAVYAGWRPNSDKGFYELYDPAINLKYGAKYLADRYDKYSEITRSEKDRWEIAIAAYNAGRGNINDMLKKAREHESKEKDKKITINDEGKWQTWDYASKFLEDITGERSRFTISYLQKVRNKKEDYTKEFESNSKEQDASESSVIARLFVDQIKDGYAVAELNNSGRSFKFPASALKQNITENCIIEVRTKKLADTSRKEDRKELGVNNDDSASSEVDVPTNTLAEFFRKLFNLLT